jgi:hypothetical protein
MEDRVGSHVPSENDVQKLVGQVESIVHKIREYAVALTPDERRSLTKFRPGGEAIVALVGQLAKKHGVDAEETSVEGMHADLLLAQRLAPLAGAADALAQLLDDTVLEAQGECWHAATANYSLLSVKAKNLPDLAESLAPARAFFATGRRRNKPSPPPTT